jgi:hypothetical protein
MFSDEVSKFLCSKLSAATWLLHLSQCFGRKTHKCQPIGPNNQLVLHLITIASHYYARFRGEEVRPGSRAQYSQSHPVGLMQVPLPLLNSLAQLFSQVSRSHRLPGYRIIERGCAHPADTFVTKSVDFSTETK